MIQGNQEKFKLFSVNFSNPGDFPGRSSPKPRGLPEKTGSPSNPGNFFQAKQDRL